MIDEDRTLEIFGYTSDSLKLQSSKPIVRVCNNCGKYSKIIFSNYNNQKHPDLCSKCVRAGKNHPNFGKHWSDETKRKMSDVKKGKYAGENNPMFGVKGKDAPCYGRTGDKHPMFGKHHSDETKKKQSKSLKGKLSGDKNPMFGKTGKNAPNWKGGIANIRKHVLPISQCTKLNKRFKGSEGHHISADVVIYIPRDLHRHLYHSLKDNTGMKEINLLSLQFIKGEL